MLGGEASSPASSWVAAHRDPPGSPLRHSTLRESSSTTRAPSIKSCGRFIRVSRYNLDHRIRTKYNRLILDKDEYLI